MSETFAAVISDIQSSSARQWTREASTRSHDGFYREIIDFAKLQGIQSVLELGMGTGEVLKEIRQMVENISAVGVEINDSNISLAIKKLQDFFRDNIIKIGESILSIQNGIVTEEFTGDPDNYPEKLVPGNLTIIQDDIRSGKLLKRVLGDLRFDMGVLSLPGVDGSMPMKSPYSFEKLDNREFMSRLAQVQHDVENACFMHFTRYIKPQGKLLYVTHLHFPPEITADVKGLISLSREGCAKTSEQIRQLIKQSIFEDHPELRENWTLQEGQILEYQNKGARTYDGQTGTDITNDVGLYQMAMLQRKSA